MSAPKPAFVTSASLGCGECGRTLWMEFIKFDPPQMRCSCLNPACAEYEKEYLYEPQQVVLKKMPK